MARKFCLFLLIIVLLASCACLPKTDNGQYIVKIAFDDGENNISGTGFVIDGGLILTAAHILTGAYESKKICSVITKSGNKYVTEILYVDERLDLAVLRSDVNKGMELSSSDPNDGSRAYILGTDKEVTATVLEIRDCLAPNKPSRLIQLDAYLPKGTSGAPITDKSGAVTGIICARSLDGEFSYAIPVTTVRAFLMRATSPHIMAD